MPCRRPISRDLSAFTILGVLTLFVLLPRPANASHNYLSIHVNGIYGGCIGINGNCDALGPEPAQGAIVKPPIPAGTCGVRVTQGNLNVWYWSDQDGGRLDQYPHSDDKGTNFPVEVFGDYPGCAVQYEFSRPLTDNGFLPCDTGSISCKIGTLVLGVNSLADVEFLDSSDLPIEWDPPDTWPSPPTVPPVVPDFSEVDFCSEWFFETLAGCSGDTDRRMSFSAAFAARSSFELTQSLVLATTGDGEDLVSAGDALLRASQALSAVETSLAKTRSQQGNILAGFQRNSTGPLTDWSSFHATVNLELADLLVRECRRAINESGVDSEFSLPEVEEAALACRNATEHLRFAQEAMTTLRTLALANEGRAGWKTWHFELLVSRIPDAGYLQEPENAQLFGGRIGVHLTRRLGVELTASRLDASNREDLLSDLDGLDLSFFLEPHRLPLIFTIGMGWTDVDVADSPSTISNADTDGLSYHFGVSSRVRLVRSLYLRPEARLRHFDTETYSGTDLEIGLAVGVRLGR